MSTGAFLLSLGYWSGCACAFGLVLIGDGHLIGWVPLALGIAVLILAHRRVSLTTKEEA